MGTLVSDVRYGIRTLRKNPGFTAVAVLTLALGIATSTAVFSLVEAALLKPLPGAQQPEELVMLERVQKGFTGDNWNYPDYLDYRDRNQSFTGLVADAGAALTFSPGAKERTGERIIGSLVSGNYFSVLGVQPSLGRLIGPQDTRVAGEAPVVVLSYGLWQRAFGADPAVVGQTVLLNGHTFTVIGVASADFGGTLIGRTFDVWLPITMEPQAMPTMTADTLENRAWGWIEILGRLKPGVRPEQAQADLQAIAASLARDYPETNATRTVTVLRHVGMDSDDRATVAGVLGLLMAVVGLLLLIACSNVTNLLLARAARRRREIAIRLALGSSRVRLLRQLLAEGLSLALLAGGAGLLLAPWITSLAVEIQQRAFGLRQLTVTLDGRVLAFTLLVSVATGVLLGLVPLARAQRKDIVSDLKDSAPASSRSRSPLAATLVVAQVALSLVLVIGAGLTARTLQKVLAVDRGFDTKNVLLASFDLSTQGYSDAASQAFYDQLLTRLRALPGVESASLAGSAPPEEWPGAVSVFYEGQAPPPDVLRGREFELGLRVNIDMVSPEYFRTLGIQVLKGRDFSQRDRPDVPRVAIVSEALAHHLWPGQDAIGKRLEVPFVVDTTGQPPVEIVGVARDTLHRSLLESPPLLLYLPRSQNYSSRGVLIVHTAGDPLGLLPAVRHEVAALDKNVPIIAPETLSQHLAESLWSQRLAAGLAGVFGTLALVLAAIGLYGVISQSVATRTHEIGIRMALGAKQSHIRDLIVSQGFKLSLAGIALGLAATAIATRGITRFLFGIRAYDPLTLAFACSVLGVVTLAASYIPARRASRVDPLVALRYE